MTINQLKSFGYGVSKVTGWKNGEYIFYLENRELSLQHNNYSVFKTVDAAWLAAERHYNKTFTKDFLDLLKLKTKLRDAYHKEERKINKQIEEMKKSVKNRVIKKRVKTVAF